MSSSVSDASPPTSTDNHGISQTDPPVETTSLSAVIAEVIGVSNSSSTTSDEPPSTSVVTTDVISPNYTTWETTAYSNGHPLSYGNSSGYRLPDPVIIEQPPSYVDPSYYQQTTNGHSNYVVPDSYENISYNSSTAPIDPNIVYYQNQSLPASNNINSGNSLSNISSSIAETTYLLSGLIDPTAMVTSGHGSLDPSVGQYSGYSHHHQGLPSAAIHDQDSHDSQGANAAPTYLDLATPQSNSNNNNR